MRRADRVDAVVLAGGYSRRMGAFKPTLPLGAGTLLTEAIATFRHLVTETWVVVGHRGDELEPVVRAAGARCVHNLAFDQGMFTSVQAGVRALPPTVSGCFVLPGDVPSVRPHTARALAAAFARTGADVVHPVYGQRGHPPLLSARLFPEVLAGGEGGLRAVLQRHEARAVEIEVLDEGILFDVDTPADYSRARRHERYRVAPTMAEARALARALCLPERVSRHSLAVAQVSLRLAAALSGAGLWLEPALVGAGALLHDVAKGGPDHARAGAHLLRRLGYPLVAQVIGQHMDLDFEPGARPDEAAIVYLADKLVNGESLVPLEARLAATLDRHGSTAEARAAISRRYRQAAAVARSVQRLTGLDAFLVASGEVARRPASAPASREHP